MAILGKYRKNKKDARNSAMPAGAGAGANGSSGTKPSMENMSPSNHSGNSTPNLNSSSTPNLSGGPRQASNNSTTSSGPYDQLPMGAPPRTSSEKASNSPKPQQSYPPQPQQHPLKMQASNTSNRSASPQNVRSPTGAMSPHGFRGPMSPPNGMPPPPHQHQQQQQPLQQQQQLQQRPGNPPVSPEASKYPWSQVTINNATPFPRYGHASNTVAGRNGEVYVMGGLKGSNVFGDLWIIETGPKQLTGYLLDTEGCPSPRVGHSSLTLGNAFIVFGGDTKIEENDDLDDNLYLLNTTTFKWTVANPVGPRPSGRYGHSLCTIGSVVYVFGGQLDDYFFDDLVCYDLTTLRSPESKWNMVQPSGQSPPPRTNHTMVSYDDKLWLFGGTDGKLWYSDTWCYDPEENSWTLLECAGFIPAPCEGHSATVIGDIMYVFGGRSSQGKDLGMLAALKLSTRKWFAFQHLGPGPSPRSGHSMTAFDGHKILVMGGESPGMPSTEDESESKNHTAFVLDTSRINYPTESLTGPPPVLQQGPQAQGHTIPPSADEKKEEQTVEGDPTRQGAPPNYSKEHARSPSGVSELTPGVGYERVDVSGGGVSSSVEEEDERDVDQKGMEAYPKEGDVSDVANIPGAWTNGHEHDESTAPTLNTDTTQSTSPSHSVSTPRDLDNNATFMSNSSKKEDDSRIYAVNDQSTPRASVTEAKDDSFSSEARDEVGQPSNVDEALERLKASNTWYESELAAARDKGYVPSSRPPVDVLKLRRVSQRLTHDNAGSLQERDILIEALGELKQELQTVQENVKEQASKASERISAAETARDDALAQLKQSDGGGSAKVQELEAKLAALEAEKERGDLTGNTEGLKTENLTLSKELRTKSDQLVLLQHELDQIKSEHEDMAAKYNDMESVADEKVAALGAASAAVLSAQNQLQESKSQLEQHRQARSELEDEVAHLKSELEEYKHKHETASRDLQEHKDLLTHAHEQNEKSTEAMSSGIEKIVAMWGGSKVFGAAASKQKSRGMDDDNDDEGEGEDPRLGDLQRRMDEINTLHQSHKEASEKATGDLTNALEEIKMLKQRLANSDLSNSGTQTQLSEALQDVETARQEFENSQQEIKELQDKQAELESYMQSSDEHAMGQSKELEQLRGEMEALRQERDELDEKSQQQVRELEKDYEQSMSYYENAQTMVEKLRTDLNQQKDENQKLEEQVEKMKQNHAAGSGGDDEEDHRAIGSPTQQGGGGSSSKSARQMELQLRDLRAQIMILQEERDDLRTSMNQLKKKQINTKQDLQDSQEKVTQLTRENQKLKAGGGAGGSSFNGADSSFADPESGETLDSYNEELEQVESERQRIRMSR